MLKTNKYGQALECIQLIMKQDSKKRDDGRIGFLRLNSNIGDFFGITNQDAISNWMKFMIKFELIKEVSTGQWKMIAKE